MEAKTVKKILYATEARADAEKAQEENYDKAIEHIERQAKMGNTEALLFGFNLNMIGVQKLMELGYAVTTIIHPFEQIKMYKISW